MALRASFTFRVDWRCTDTGAKGSDGLYEVRRWFVTVVVRGVGIAIANSITGRIIEWAPIIEFHQGPSHHDE